MLSNRGARLFLHLWLGVGVLLLVGLGWWAAASQYQRLVAAGASRAAPQLVRVESASKDFHLIRDGAPGLRVSVDGSLFQAGLLVLLALVLATPGMPFWSRIGWATGVTVLFMALNIGALALSAWAVLWTAQGRALTIGRVEPLLDGLYLAVPFVLAAVWCWHFWLSGIDRGREQAAR